MQWAFREYPIYTDFFLTCVCVLKFVNKSYTLKMSTSEQNFQRKLFKMKRKPIKIDSTKKQESIKKNEQKKEVDELTK